MSRRRFYAPPGDFDLERRTARLAREEARHLSDVLRLGRGDEVFVFDGEGREYRCRVTEAGRAQALLEVCEEVEAARPSSPLRLTLCVALLKGEKFDLVVQKATELGVASIIAVVTKYADVRVKDEADAVRRLARWKRIALEAAKQSGRACLPELLGPMSFASVIESEAIEAAHCRLFFSERGGRALLEAMAECPEDLKRAVALVGPEGGWSEEELEGARSGGWSVVTLGGRVLRAETAAIVTTALLQHLRGDLR
ncbi:MAG TPA: 16S rRNA (uracil(1498)-N(3))-methyltransferase [Pyrinomonadaceae bacterium]|jgi:16S rRNA (uracil1498-N3)-methyltransferase